MDMARSVQWFELAYKGMDAEFSLEMHNLLNDMSDYICWITQPDMKIPSIGDSPLRERKFSFWCSNHNYEWMYTDGEKGYPPKENGKIFWEAGYAVFRSDWNFSAFEGTWMMLLAATHSEAHKHNDDLSFLLYHRGPLFVEGGCRNYNYSEGKTQYIYSSYAHNVLFINNRGWQLKETTHLPLLEQEAFDTAIVDGCTEGDVSWATGMQTRFVGICQKRTLRYDKIKNIVYVEDSIDLKEAASIRLIYHIAEDIEIKEKSDGWFLMRDDNAIAYVSVFGTSHIERGVYLDDGEGPWKTWIFNGKIDEKKGSLLYIDTIGNEGKNEINLQIKLY